MELKVEEIRYFWQKMLKLWDNWCYWLVQTVIVLGLAGCQRRLSDRSQTEKIGLTWWEGVNPPLNQDVLQSLVDKTNSAVTRGESQRKPRGVNVVNQGAIAALQLWRNLFKDHSAVLSLPERGYEQEEVGRSRPIYPGYNRVSDNLGRAIESVLLGKNSPKEALFDAQKRLDLIFP